MISNPHDSFTQGAVPGSAEETLLLIASLPAPNGLEDRVEAVLRSAPRGGQVLLWPKTFRPASFHIDRPWLRVAAAAAIAFVVVGGGWGVYSHVERQQAAKVIVVPARPAATGGFSNAGAIRTPQTLNGPVLAQPADASSAANRRADATGKRSIKKKRRPTPAAKARNSAAAAVAPAK